MLWEGTFSTPDEQLVNCVPFQSSPSGVGTSWNGGNVPLPGSLSLIQLAPQWTALSVSAMPGLCGQAQGTANVSLQISLVVAISSFFQVLDELAE